MLKGKFRFPPHLTERTQPPPAGGSGGQRSTQLQLNLIKFKCVDEMDWEVTDFGKDNISAGGKAWDTAGTNTDVSVFRVADFDGGDVFTFNPPRVFARYGLSGEQWPRFFFAQVALAEKDADGGFIEFLQKLWDAVDDTVIKEATDAILAALAAAGVGAAAGAIAGVEAAGVGAIVGAVVGAVIGFAV